MSKRGQSIMEYSFFMIILLAVFLIMNTYVKRGIQGRWKASVDGFGDQYDPKTANSLVSYNLVSNSSTMLGIGYDATTGTQFTNRSDATSSTESKTENTMVN